MYSGDFILVNSNEIHAIDALKPNKTVVIQIPLKTFSDYFTGEQYIRFTHESKEQDVSMMELIQDMFQVYKEKKTGYEMQVKSDYYKLLYFLVTMYRELKVREDLLKQNKKLNKLTPITTYIREHYQEEVSLESLAELRQTEHTISEVALNHGFPSSRAFTKAFQKRYGMLPSEYLKKK